MAVFTDAVAKAVPDPAPVAGDCTPKPVPTGTATHMQLSPVDMLTALAPPYAGMLSLSDETEYWQAVPESGRLTLQTPRPVVNAKRLLAPAPRSNARLTTGTSAYGASSRAQVIPPSRVTNVPRSLPA